MSEIANWNQKFAIRPVVVFPVRHTYSRHSSSSSQRGKFLSALTVRHMAPRLGPTLSLPKLDYPDSSNAAMLKKPENTDQKDLVLRPLWSVLPSCTPRKEQFCVVSSSLSSPLDVNILTVY
jgi:hypothetical protein